MKENYETCKASGKACLSEAAALRRVQRYEDIERYYLCNSCGYFHLTSREAYPYLEKQQTIKTVHPDTITNRLNYLKKQIKKNGKENK